ncbi:hypothetical protein [Streptomyces adelaidensis]|uniref:hypothetical protein n=1 Tax=Streptomyces adelaidensis TaxID=2796465 RepID=UPI001905A2FC|nr:hypothetical protein [Streptomyces adelaidensis]
MDVSGARLLPWVGAGGKRCYLVGDGAGYVSRLADDIESVQLGMAGELLSHAADILADRRVTPAQLRFLLARMSESLTDVQRIAVSRGGRLSASVGEGEGEGEGAGGEDGPGDDLDDFGRLGYSPASEP